MADVWEGHAPHPDVVDSNDIFFLIDFDSFEVMGKGWKKKNLRRVIFYNVTRSYDSDESRRRWMGYHWNRKRAAYDGNVQHIFDYDPRGASKKFPRPAPTTACPWGYHRLFEIREDGEALADVCFLGWVYRGGRRDGIVSRLEEAGLTVAVCTRYPKTRRQHNDPMRWVSRARNARALRAKVFLNIQTDKKNKTLPLPRIMTGIANRLPIVTEPADWYPWGDKDFVVVSGKESFPDVIRMLCDSVSFCRTLTDAAYEWAKGEFSLELHLRRALRDIGFV